METPKPKRRRRSLDEQAADLDRKRARESMRALARANLDEVRAHMIARQHTFALEAARSLAQALQRVVEIELEIAAAREQDGEPAKAAQ